MTRRNRTPKRQVEEAVRAAGRTRLKPAETRTNTAVDLSAEAIAARGGGGNLTGRHLVEYASRVFDRANEFAAQASAADNRVQRKRLDVRSDEALATAAAQIRLAALTPLDKPYLHALSLEQIQIAKAEVVAAMRVDAAAVAVDTLRRIRGQRNRIRIEGGPR